MPFRPVVNISYALDRRLWGYRAVRVSPDQPHCSTPPPPRCCSCSCSAPFATAARRRAAPRTRRRTARDLGGVRRRRAVRRPSDSVGDRRVRVVAFGDPVRAVSDVARCCWRGWPGSPPAGVAPRRRAHGGAVAALGAVGCAVLAMLSKEVAAALPVLFLGYDWLLRHSRLAGDAPPRVLVFVPLAPGHRAGGALPGPLAGRDRRHARDGAAAQPADAVDRDLALSRDDALAGRPGDHARRAHRDDARPIRWPGGGRRAGRARRTRVCAPRPMAARSRWAPCGGSPASPRRRVSSRCRRRWPSIGSTSPAPAWRWSWPRWSTGHLGAARPPPAACRSSSRSGWRRCSPCACS